MGKSCWGRERVAGTLTRQSRLKRPEAGLSEEGGAYDPGRYSGDSGKARHVLLASDWCCYFSTNSMNCRAWTVPYLYQLLGSISEKAPDMGQYWVRVRKACESREWWLPWSPEVACFTWPTDLDSLSVCPEDGSCFSCLLGQADHPCSHPLPNHTNTLWLFSHVVQVLIDE